MTHPRERIITALMELVAETPWDEVTLSDVAAKAGLSLAEFREQFPSKGAILAAFSRQIDMIVLRSLDTDLASEPPKDRLFDILMRRLDALRPYKAALSNIMQWARRSPAAAMALNQVALNSHRFMLEAAGISSEGPVGTLKLQGLVIGFSQVLETWLTDDDEDMARTMAALDRLLERGGRMVARAEDFQRLTSPFCNLLGGVMRLRKHEREARRDI